MYFDAHNHLASPALAPHRAQIFTDLATARITRAVVNGTCETDWPDVAALAREHPVVLPSYGLHPWEVGNRSLIWLETLRRYLTADPHAAVGEIGLDRWMLERARPDDPRLAGLRRAPLDEQLSVLSAQLALATEFARPVTIHCIDAFGLLHDTLQNSPHRDALRARGFLLHAYSGSAELLPAFAKLGAYFSFNAAYLAPRHARLREVFKLIPIDRLLVETDAPAMLAPSEHAPFSLPSAPGLNHPANLAAAYAALAAIRSLSLKDLSDQVSKNFRQLFSSAHLPV